MRMSSGPSARKLKPRSGVSSCGDETPRSRSTPSTLSQPCSLQHVFKFFEISLFPSKTFRPSGLQRPGRFRRFTVLVQPEDLRPLLQQRLRVTAAPERPVDPPLPRPHPRRRQHLGQQNGQVPHRLPRVSFVVGPPTTSTHLPAPGGASAGRFNPTSSKALRRASLTTEEPMISPLASFLRFEPVNQLPAHKTFDFDFHIPRFAFGLDDGPPSLMPFRVGRGIGHRYILVFSGPFRHPPAGPSKIRAGQS